MKSFILANLSSSVAFYPRHYELRLKKVSAPYSYGNEFGEGHYDLQSGDPILEGTAGEHWSPSWKKISKKYLLADGSAIEELEIPADVWVTIQTDPDESVRKNSLVWVLPQKVLAGCSAFEIDGLTINPDVDVICIGGDEKGPNLEWGIWPVKKIIFQATYQQL